MDQKIPSITELIEGTLPGATPEMLSFVRSAIEKLPLAAKSIREGLRNDGFEIIAAASDGLKLVITCLNILKEESSSEETVIFAKKSKLLLGTAVADVISLMEIGDNASIADLLEYEITPVLRRLYERLQSSNV